MTDSRYRLSMIAARRAAQIKLGVQPMLTHEEYPQTRNTVTLALTELALNKNIQWGSEKDLPTTEEIKKMLERERKEQRDRENESFSVRHQS